MPKFPHMSVPISTILTRHNQKSHSHTFAHLRYWTSSHPPFLYTRKKPPALWKTHPVEEWKTYLRNNDNANSQTRNQITPKPISIISRQPTSNRKQSFYIIDGIIGDMSSKILCFPNELIVLSRIMCFHCD